MTGYAGVLSLLFQPIMGILWSTAFLALAALGGLLLRIPPIGTRWRSSPLWAICITLISLFGSFVFGWTTTVTTEEGETLTLLRSEIFSPSYFALLFAIAHWPIPPSLTSAPADSRSPPTSPSSRYPDP